MASGSNAIMSHSRAKSRFHASDLRKHITFATFPNGRVATTVQTDCLLALALGVVYHLSRRRTCSGCRWGGALKCPLMNRCSGKCSHAAPYSDSTQTTPVLTLPREPPGPGHNVYVVRTLTCLTRTPRRCFRGNRLTDREAHLRIN